ncbi:MAG TPA: transposase [Dehalococcoidia bacterium]|nr:transposase [Dehalococcoidia bacterium]
MAPRVRWTRPRPGETSEEARTGKRETQANHCRPCSRQADIERSGRGKLLSPSRRRKCVERVQRVLPRVSERRACRVVNQPRPTQRRTSKSLDDEESLTRDIIKLAVRFGRYGYRRITALLRDQGWQVNHKRVERIWRRERLKVPKKQPKRGRLWLNESG